jgi:hypothetical protein
MDKKIKVDLDWSEIVILRHALPIHLSRQLASEPDTEERQGVARELLERFDSGRIPSRFKPEEVSELAEACDSYLYWEVSDPGDRNDGYVNYEGTEYEEEAREIEALQEKLTSLVR